MTTHHIDVDPGVFEAVVDGRLRMLISKRSDLHIGDQVTIQEAVTPTRYSGRENSGWTISWVWKGRGVVRGYQAVGIERQLAYRIEDIINPKGSPQ